MKGLLLPENQFLTEFQNVVFYMIANFLNII